MADEVVKPYRAGSLTVAAPTLIEFMLAGGARCWVALDHIATIEEDRSRSMTKVRISGGDGYLNLANGFDDVMTRIRNAIAGVADES